MIDYRELLKDINIDISCINNDGCPPVLIDNTNLKLIVSEQHNIYIIMKI